jgi:hypothetical protein
VPSRTESEGNRPRIGRPCGLFVPYATRPRPKVTACHPCRGLAVVLRFQGRDPSLESVDPFGNTVERAADLLVQVLCGVAFWTVAHRMTGNAAERAHRWTCRVLCDPSRTVLHVTTSLLGGGHAPGAVHAVAGGTCLVPDRLVLVPVALEPLSRKALRLQS